MLGPVQPRMSRANLVAMTDSRRSTVNQIHDLFAARGLGFLLSQVGAHSSRRWAERLAAIDLDSRQVMLLWNIAAREGRSQNSLATSMHLPSSRIVGLVDALERRGWVKRRTNTADRRAKTVHLTGAGRNALDLILAVAAEHEAELSQGLQTSQRDALVELLERVAHSQGLVPAVHPDF
jgi:DNA-binding MarR family transcriptional regulator